MMCGTGTIILISVLMLKRVRRMAERYQQSVGKYFRQGTNLKPNQHADRKLPQTLRRTYRHYWTLTDHTTLATRIYGVLVFASRKIRGNAIYPSVYGRRS